MFRGLIAVQQDANALQYVKYQTLKIVLIAIRKYPNAITFVNQEMIVSLAMHSLSKESFFIK
jgi:hypothetical protein